MEMASRALFRPLAPVCWSHLNVPSGQGVDPGIYACPATSEYQYMLAVTIDDGKLKILIVGRG